MPAGDTVVVVGSYNHDHVWRVDALPAPGATRAATYAGGPGGKGFNQAVAAARAGARTVFVAALGADAAATEARVLCAADGIDLRDEVVAGEPSGSAGIFVDAAGANVIAVAPGANGALTPAFVAAQHAAFAQAAVVLAQLEVPAGAVREALRAARAAGALAMLNPAPANVRVDAALLAEVDVLTPNETEFAALLASAGVPVSGRCGADDLSCAGDAIAGLDDGTFHALCRRIAPDATLVVTLGAAGAFVSHPDARRRGDDRAFHRVPAPPAAVVDTTGAGDAFSGALAARLATHRDAPFRDAVAFAARYASRSTERPGAALAMPRHSEL
jgi:ribokinase